MAERLAALAAPMEPGPGRCLALVLWIAKNTIAWAPTGAVMGQVAGWCAWRRHLSRRVEIGSMLSSYQAAVGAAAWSPAAWIRASGPTTV